jgi:beta-N-acetylhexosaminidase
MAVETDAFKSGRELRELGLTLNLAPVAEILTEENRDFLEDRSYGPDPVFTEAAAAAFIRGMDRAGIAAVVKHFPGNAAADPHGGKVLLKSDGDSLDAMVRPFASLIQEPGPSAIMVSHVIIPAWDGERNASLSPAVIQTRLREELGFTGIVLADDFSMGAVAASGLRPADAAVEALIAGVDMVMTWPMNIREIRGAILAAVQNGRLSRERLRDAAARIIAEKIRYGIEVERGGERDG